MLELTQEQQECVKGAITGQNLKTKAFAGAGKTSTLVAIASALKDKRVLYLAYNKAIATEAKGKFPDNVDCKTAHSLAYCSFIDVIGKRLTDKYPKLNNRNLIKYAGITAKHDCNADEIATKILRILRGFVQSSCDESYLLPKPLQNCFTKEAQKVAEIEHYIQQVAHYYWHQCIKPDSEFPITHDIYLKLYQLSKPDLSLAYDVILFDECQDANPVILDIVINQKCQKIYVGDEHQQIYAWRGAINAFSGLDGAEYYLSQSFRFGNSIAKLANAILSKKEEKQLLKGFDSMDSQIVSSVDFPYTALCRTNNRAIDLMLNNLDKNIHLVGNNVKSMIFFLESGVALYTNDMRRVKHDLLKGYKSWQHCVNEYEESEEKDNNLAMLMNFVDKYKNNLWSTLEKLKNISCTRENDADLVIFTIHKSKGREWDNVVIENDFILSSKSSVEDWNLLYVAVTRAQKKLCLKNGLETTIYNLINN